MYHIKHDQRSLTSARMLLEGLNNCLSNKKFKDISIQELCNASQVSRTTFYRLFDTTTDLLQYSVDILGEDAAASLSGAEIANGDEYIRFQLEFIDRHKDVMQVVLKADRPDILTQAMTKNQGMLLPPEIRERFTREETDYITAVVSASIVAIYKVNVSNGYNTSVMDLHEILRKVFELLGEVSTPYKG